MDSMRSLNTSLPPTSPRKRHTSQRPEQLLQAFRSAALSVTNLYKTAASDQTRAHDEGYQDALQDLLNLLDRENLGLSDGEGWRVRQWATERFQGTPAAVQQTSDSDEDAEEEKRARSSSPTMQRKPGGDTLQPNQSAAQTSPVRPESAPPVPVRRPSVTPPDDPTPQFTFQSNHLYPSHHEVDMDTVENGSDQGPTTRPSMRVELLSRHARHSTRNSGPNSRGNNRLSSSLNSPGSAASMKRKIPFGDFFDISGLGNGRDGPGGGGKRGRLT